MNNVIKLPTRTAKIDLSLMNSVDIFSKELLIEITQLLNYTVLPRRYNMDMSGYNTLMVAAVNGDDLNTVLRFDIMAYATKVIQLDDGYLGIPGKHSSTTTDLLMSYFETEEYKDLTYIHFLMNYELIRYDDVNVHASVRGVIDRNKLVTIIQCIGTLVSRNGLLDNEQEFDTVTIDNVVSSCFHKLCSRNTQVHTVGSGEPVNLDKGEVLEDE